MRALAFELCGDSHRAEDLVQETWLTALRRPGGSIAQPRPWLSQVLRHLAFRGAGRAGRRTEREAGAAREDETSSASLLVEQVSTQRALCEHVLALREPYRHVVLLRFFDDLPPREIADRLGISVNTVGSRLQRGLELLRDDLDRASGGDRSQWMSALVPFARNSTPWWAAGPLVWIMKPTVIALSCVLAVLIGLGLRSWGVESPGAPQAPSVPSSLTEVEPVGNPTQGAEREGLPAVEGSSATGSAETPQGPALGRTPIRGRVIGVDGLGLAGVEVHGAAAQSDNRWPQVVVSARDGSFEIGPFDEPYYLYGSSSRHVNLVRALVDVPPKEGVARIVMAPRGRFQGRIVLGDSGRPASGLLVQYRQGTAWHAGLGITFELSMPASFSGSTDASGAFDLLATPLVRGAEFVVEAPPGYRDLRVTAPLQSEAGLEWTLEKIDFEGRGVRGRVVDGSGVGIENAWISIGSFDGRSSAEGSFAVPTPGLAGGEPLRVAARGHLPVILEDPAGRGADEPGWGDHILVRVTDPSRTIEGVVVDAEGNPLEGVGVSIDDPEYFGRVEGRHTWVEAASLGRNTVSGSSTDAEGRFRLEGLTDRAYVLKAVDYGSLRIATLAGVPAGTTGLEIVLPELGEGMTLAGRCVDPDGNGVAGVKVWVKIVIHRRVIPSDPLAPGEDTVGGLQTTTGEGGTFEIQGVPEGLSGLVMEGPGIMPGEWNLEEGADLGSLEVPVDPRFELSIAVGSGHDSADGFMVYDEGGEPLMLMIFYARSSSGTGRGELEDGASPAYTLSSRARRIVLYDGWTELASREVHPRPGESMSVRFEKP